MSGRRSIAVDDPDPVRRARLTRMLETAGLPVAASVDEVPFIILAAEGPTLQPRLEAASARWPSARRIILVNGWELPTTSGADAVLHDGFNPARLIPAASAALHVSRQSTHQTQCELVGESAAMRQLRAEIEEIAAAEVTVLIMGETGSGKDCAARMLHRLSPRKPGPLIAVNCAAVPDALLEGELFGFERGAFTGAVRAFPGKFRLAHGGTLFLDEVGDLSAPAQAKILRAVETREVQRLGSLKSEAFDARLVAATNANLHTRVADGVFRADLFYRIAVAILELPSLRDRRDDIPLLADHLLQRNPAHTARAFTAAAHERLCAHDWPGNVRELMNVVEIAAIRSKAWSIGPEHLPLRAGPVVPRPLVTIRKGQDAAGEKALIVRTLAENMGNKSRAAARLSWSRMTLYRKLEQHGLSAAL